MALIFLLKEVLFNVTSTIVGQICHLPVKGRKRTEDLAGWVPNSADPGQTLLITASNLGLNCLFRHYKGKYGDTTVKL